MLPNSENDPPGKWPALALVQAPISGNKWPAHRETFGKFAWFVKLIIFLSTSPSDPPFQSVYIQQSMDSCNLFINSVDRTPKSCISVLHWCTLGSEPAFVFLLVKKEIRRLICLNGVKLLNLPQPQFLDKSILPSLIKLVFSNASIHLLIVRWS